MNDNKSNAGDISRRLNISESTVSKALNNCGYVNPQIKAAVIRAADEAGYTPAQKMRRAEQSAGRGNGRLDRYGGIFAVGVFGTARPRDQRAVRRCV